MKLLSLIAGLSGGLASAAMLVLAAVAAPPEPPCKPTPPDALGPFYQAGAPVRAKVGEGYVLRGVVRSTGCTPIPGARLEFWLAGPDGRYDDAHRATLFADEKGAYRFESNFPPPYSFRPSHIHLKVSAPGFKTLVTQHYPKKGTVGATFGLVLIPEG